MKSTLSPRTLAARSIARLAVAGRPATVAHATLAEVGANDFRISEMGFEGSISVSGTYGRVAYNATDDEYLVVWYGAETTQGDEDIWGQRRRSKS